MARQRRLSCLCLLKHQPGETRRTSSSLRVTPLSCLSTARILQSRRALWSPENLVIVQILLYKDTISSFSNA